MFIKALHTNLYMIFTSVLIGKEELFLPSQNEDIEVKCLSCSRTLITKQKIELKGRLLTRWLNDCILKCALTQQTVFNLVTSWSCQFLLIHPSCILSLSFVCVCGQKTMCGSGVTSLLTRGSQELNSDHQA